MFYTVAKRLVQRPGPTTWLQLVLFQLYTFLTKFFFAKININKFTQTEFYGGHFVSQAAMGEHIFPVTDAAVIIYVQ